MLMGLHPQEPHEQQGRGPTGRRRAKLIRGHHSLLKQDLRDPGPGTGHTNALLAVRTYGTTVQLLKASHHSGGARTAAPALVEKVRSDGLHGMLTILRRQYRPMINSQSLNHRQNHSRSLLLWMRVHRLLMIPTYHFRKGAPGMAENCPHFQ